MLNVNATKTVRRNTKRFAAIFAQATRASSFSLNNGFSGQDCDLAWVREKLPAEVARLDAKVRDEGEGKFTVRFHSNYWVVVYAPV